MADATFSLDLIGGREVLTEMCAPIVEKSANAIAERAGEVAGKMTNKDTPKFNVSVATGTIKRGQRAVATVQATANNSRMEYIANMALSKSKDAGKVA